MIDVVSAGPLTTIQDLGRIGWAHLGIPRAGALDAPALARANALVGNDVTAAGLEITLTGCVLRFRTPSVVAVTGAVAAVTLDGSPQPRDTLLPVRADGTLRIGPATSGVRSYLAVRGGIDVPPVLGSRSYDTLARIGPPILRNGTELPIGPPPPPRNFTEVAHSAGPRPRDFTEVAHSEAPQGRDFTEVARSEAPQGREYTGVAELRVRFGPRDDWFVGEARSVLCGSAYEMTTSSNRVGARLSGAPLVRAHPATELPSEGIVLGAIQVTPDGMPIVFLADHPTTGGYPVIGVVETADVYRLAQVRPGASVRFTEVTDGSQR
jgi:biotin-dependent carboxylase-like uncharacterized protein